jgi:N-acetylglucosamine-6-phosphate deacetylase
VTVIVIANATVFTPEQTIAPGTVLIEGATITSVGPSERLRPPPDAEVIDAAGLKVVPGFIDLQVNGAFGHDFTRNAASVMEVAAQLPRHGVTSFLPTIISSPLDSYPKILQSLSQAKQTGVQAAVLGVHLEGPYLSPQRPGAHNPDCFRLPRLKDLARFAPIDTVRLMTLAPELPGALEFIAALLERGLVLSAGHSAASCDQARAALAAGVSYGTHLFNAMSPLHHRDPGLPGTLLTDERARVGIIADGLHLHPAIVKLTWEAKGADAITLVTDAMAAMGMPPGNYWLGDQEVIVDETSARLKDGTLAGSILTMDQAIRNVIEFTGCSVAEALTMATKTPAAVLNLAQYKGQLCPGFDADITLLDHDLHVVGTIVRGTIAYGLNPMLFV